MSEYGKAQDFSVYEYNAATRAEQAQDYTAFAAHQTYPPSYVANPSQVPSGLPQTAAAFIPTTTTTSQHYGTHDPSYYAPQQVSYSSYVAAPPAPRSLPEVVSYSPTQGPARTKITIRLRSAYDLDLPPVRPVVMFGEKHCQTILSRMDRAGPPFEYSLSAEAPLLTPTSPPSSQVSLSLTFGDSPVSWQSPSIEFGTFAYVNQAHMYSSEPSAQPTSRKRKVDPEASPRRSPTKKPSMHQLSAQGSGASIASPSSPAFRRPSAAAAYPSARRASGPSFQQQNFIPSLRSTQSQYFFSTPHTTPPLPPLPTSQNLSWAQAAGNPQPTTASPSAPAASAARKSSLLPSPSSNPALVRTSTLQQSPTTPGVNISTPQQFNPYTMYPANAKAVLKLEGDLNTMTQKWNSEEWEAGRRLVQFRRSQQGSVINATFEPVTLEDRIPNSICVSCIWWAEKQECFVTSVDTISLLESLVAVRFTVEEKNRIRRNLEGFRPLTVSKQKSESDDFFKLIMGFPNPKPRNIEKDVKVFPWRILAGALKKIIGKYSASYSSTAGALHTPSTGVSSKYTASRAPEGGGEQQRPAASPLPTSSPATSRSHAYAFNLGNTYPVSAASTGLGIATGSTPSGAGAADLRLTVPLPAGNQATSWHHHPSAQYSNTLFAPARGASWELNNAYLNRSPPIGLSNSAAPAVGLPNPARSQQYAPNIAPPAMAPHSTMPVNARFVPLQTYQDSSQQTSNA